MNQLQAVLFDLDGTLIDTAPDLAQALNVQLQKHQKAPLPFEMIRPHVSNGAGALIKLGFDIESNHPDFEALRLEYLHIYQDHIHIESRFFDGMETLLDLLEQRHIAWGIVTNKPAFLTDVLLERMGYQHRSQVTISGDTLPVRKPSPIPLLHAAQLIECDAKQCVYVGDALRDIEAARGANMYSIAAAYGYIGTEPPIDTWQADLIVQDVAQLQQALLAFLDNHVA